MLLIMRIESVQGISNKLFLLFFDRMFVLPARASAPYVSAIQKMQFENTVGTRYQNWSISWFDVKQNKI